MDFDHRDPHDKTANLSAAWAGGWTRERVLEEAAKCDVVCANCHRIRTHGPANQEWVEELRVRQSAQLGVILGTD